MASKKRGPHSVVDLASARNARRRAAILNTVGERLEKDALQLIAARHPKVAGAALFAQCVAALIRQTPDIGTAYEVAHAAADLLRFYRDADKAMSGPTGILTPGVRARILKRLRAKRNDDV